MQWRSTTLVHTDSSEFHPELRSEKAVDALAIFAENLCQADKQLRLSTLRILCHYESLASENIVRDRPAKKLKMDDSQSLCVDEHGSNVWIFFLAAFLLYLYNWLKFSFKLQTLLKPNVLEKSTKWILCFEPSHSKSYFGVKECIRRSDAGQILGRWKYRINIWTNLHNNNLIVLIIISA